MKRFGKNSKTQKFLYLTSFPSKKLDSSVIDIAEEDPIEKTYNYSLLQRLKQSNKENFNDNLKRKKMLRLSELENSNLYHTLSLPENCTDDQIRQAYKKLSIIHHPDKGGDPNTFNKIQEAYKILSYPLTRKIFDTFGTKSIKIINEIIIKNQLSCTNECLLQQTIQQGDLDALACLFQINN